MDKEEVFENYKMAKMNVQMIRASLEEINVDNRNETLHGDYTNEMNFGIRTEELDSNTCKGFLKTSIYCHNDHTNEIDMDITVIYSGIFETNETWEDIQFKKWVEAQTVPQLLSYTRSIITHITSMMNIPPILLPTIDVVQSLEDNSHLNNKDGNRKMSLEKISFEESDYEHPHLEDAAEEIAFFLFESSSYILDKFTDFMRTSSTQPLKNYKPFVQKWFASIIKNRKKEAPDKLRLEGLCYRFFEVCRNDRDIKKLRGLVPEKLFEKVFEERHSGKKCKKGYGVKVLVNGKSIIYRPSDPYENGDDSDKNRQTVDAGFWDGGIGEFVEIKLQPEAFQTKDINYLRVLAEELKGNNISYTIFLIALGNKELIRKKLIRLGLIGENDSNEFKMIGKDELFRFTA